MVVKMTKNNMFICNPKIEMIRLLDKKETGNYHGSVLRVYCCVTRSLLHSRSEPVIMRQAVALGREDKTAGSGTVGNVSATEYG